jgi:acetoacetate decarboxylase
LLINPYEGGAMLYSLGKEQIQKLSNLHHLSDFMNAEMLMAVFRTDMDVVKEIIPRPLLPTEQALATAFIARYPETNFGCIYKEGALFISCQYKGEKGFYCLSMPVDDDTAMVGGREQLGFPKKMADKITLDKKDNSIIGSVVRKKVEILRIEGDLGNETSEDVLSYLGDTTTDWDGEQCYRVLSFLFKFFLSPDGSNFDYFPRLVRQATLFRRLGKTVQVTGKVTLSSTPCDPLGEVSVGDIIGIIYGQWHNTMLPGKVVTKIWNPMKFVKHSFFKSDFIPTIINNYDPKLVARAKEIMKIAKKY